MNDENEQRVATKRHTPITKEKKLETTVTTTKETRNVDICQMDGREFLADTLRHCQHFGVELTIDSLSRLFEEYRKEPIGVSCGADSEIIPNRFVMLHDTIVSVLWCLLKQKLGYKPFEYVSSHGSHNSVADLIIYRDERVILTLEDVSILTEISTSDSDARRALGDLFGRVERPISISMNGQVLEHYWFGWDGVEPCGDAIRVIVYQRAHAIRIRSALSTN